MHLGPGLQACRYLGGCSGWGGISWGPGCLFCSTACLEWSGELFSVLPGRLLRCLHRRGPCTCLPACRYLRAACTTAITAIPDYRYHSGCCSVLGHSAAIPPFLPAFDSCRLPLRCTAGGRWVCLPLPLPAHLPGDAWVPAAPACRTCLPAWRNSALFPYRYAILPAWVPAAVMPTWSTRLPGYRFLPVLPAGGSVPFLCLPGGLLFDTTSGRGDLPFLPGRRLWADYRY